MLRAWFLHHENTQSVQTGIWTPNLRMGVPACYNHKATAALKMIGGYCDFKSARLGSKSKVGNQNKIINY